jgi:hypothetical protein
MNFEKKRNGQIKSVFEKKMYLKILTSTLIYGFHITAEIMQFHSICSEVKTIHRI